MEYQAKYKHARQLSEMTQSEAARSLEVSIGTVANWEVGTTLPNASQIVAMAKLYGVSCDQLLGLKPLVAQD